MEVAVFAQKQLAQHRQQLIRIPILAQIIDNQFRRLVDLLLFVEQLREGGEEISG